MSTPTITIDRGTSPARFVLTWPADATGDDNLVGCTAEVFEPDTALADTLSLQVTDEDAREITGTLTLTNDQWLTFPKFTRFIPRVIYPSGDHQAAERITIDVR